MAETVDVAVIKDKLRQFDVLSGLLGAREEIAALCEDIVVDHVADLLAEVESLKSQLAARDALLTRLLQWDHFDGAGDGPYWRREINAVLDVRLRVGTPHKEPSNLAGQAATKGEGGTGPAPTLHRDPSDQEARQQAAERAVRAGVVWPRGES